MNEQQHTRQTRMEDILFTYATYVWMYALKSGTPDAQRPASETRFLLHIYLTMEGTGILRHGLI